MRRLLIVTILFLLVLGGLWLGGETLLARELRKLAAEDPAIEVAAVSELREFRRIGARRTFFSRRHEIPPLAAGASSHERQLKTTLPAVPIAWSDTAGNQGWG